MSRSPDFLRPTWFARLFPGVRLPGVLSTTEFQQAFLRERSLVDRRQRPFSLIAFVPSGDQEPRSLPQLVSLLRERLRTADVIGRLNSDHLAALLPATDGQGAWVVAESVLHRLAELGLKYDCKVYAYPCDPPANRAAAAPASAPAATGTVGAAAEAESQQPVGYSLSGHEWSPGAAAAELDGNSNGDGTGTDQRAESTATRARTMRSTPARPRSAPSASAGGQRSLKDTAFLDVKTLNGLRIDRDGAIRTAPHMDSQASSRELDAIRVSASARPVDDLRPYLIEPLPVWKRAMDIAASAFALTALAPVFALIAVVIKLDSKGPIIFRQQRAGAGGRPFTFYKFRSMHPNAEAMRAELEAMNEKNGPIFKIKNDPRITRVGGFIRRWSLDELPQIYNVLRGDMSLVGPRPPTLNELPGYQAWQRRRLELTGGLTCIWQVSGRSDVSFEDWMRMDLRYARSRTLKRDLVLIAKTATAIVTGRGAY